MLQFTIKPEASVTKIESPVSKATLREVQAHIEARVARAELSEKTGRSYCGAIDKIAAWLNTPLELLPADLDWFAEKFPLDGFDPVEHPTNKAYQLFRRRIQASLREFCGVHAAIAALRAEEDSWTDLLAVLEPHTEERAWKAELHPMQFQALKTFTLVARAHGFQPRDLDLSSALVLEGAYSGNKRAANRRALRVLDTVRRFPEALPYLPPQPIGFTPEIRKATAAQIPEKFETEVQPWIDHVTRSGWDPIAERFSDDHAKHRHVMNSAFRRYLRLALELGILAPGSNTVRPAFEKPEHVRQIAGAMFALKDRARADGRLAVRSTRKYLKLIRQALQGQQIDTALLDQILRNNRDARAGTRAEKQMTKKNRSFCQMLINDTSKRQRFLLCFRTLREAAEERLALLTATDQAPTGHQLSRLRMLGTAAAFAAIEIGGAPIRIRNAMGLTLVGEDAQLQQRGKRKSSPFHVHIPAAETKQHGLTRNALPIEFTIRHNRHGCHETLLWYLETIRPLYPHAGSSAYLFPAVQTPGAHLDPGWFGEEFNNLMREVIDLPMTPHMMRHGQTSLLLHRHPDEIEVIAKRIGSHVATLRTYYGWIDGVKLVERGQDLLVGLMEE